MHAMNPSATPTSNTVEPVTLAQARLHLRLDVSSDDPEDELIEDFITSAREEAENFTGLALVEQQFVFTMGAFPTVSSTVDGGIELPMGSPFTSLDLVEYKDSDGEWAELDAEFYTVKSYEQPTKIYPVTSWPSTTEARFTYTAGYTDNIPKIICSAIKLILGSLYESRENDSPLKLDTIPMSAQMLLRRYRILLGMA